MTDENHPYDLVIGLDRSDQKADLSLINTRTRERKKQTLSTSPEDLHDRLAGLRQEHSESNLARSNGALPFHCGRTTATV